MNFEIEYETIIKEAYGIDYYLLVKDKIDEMGFIDKVTIARLLGETGMEFPEDSWIMDLDDWDYEVHSGKEAFRPSILRGKIIRKEHKL